MNAKRKGAQLEWAVERALKEAGFEHVQRGSASRGIDIIAGRLDDGMKLFISCKNTKSGTGYIKPSELLNLKTLATFWGAIPCTTVFDDQEWRILSLLDYSIILGGITLK